MLKNLLLSVNLGHTLKLLMLLLYILTVKMYEEKVSKIIGLLINYVIRVEGCVWLDRPLQSHLPFIFATNGPNVKHVMMLFCATSSKGAMLVCSDST